MRRLSLVRKAVVLSAAVVSLSSFAATTHDVSTVAELTTALGSARVGDTIRLADGDYLTSSTILLDKAITLAGATRDGVKIDSQQLCSTITITDAGAVVTNLTVRNGKSAETGVDRRGGGIFMSGGGTVVGCRVTACAGERQAKGLAIYNVGGTVRDCVIDNCSCNTDILSGSVYQEGAAALIDSCVITNCTDTSTMHQADGCVMGLYLNGGVCTNTLISRCSNGTGGVNSLETANKVAVAALVLSGAVLTDCTIVDNAFYTLDADLTRPGAVSVASGGLVRNCLIYGATDTDGLAANLGSSDSNTAKDICSTNCCLGLGETAGLGASNFRSGFPFYEWRQGRLVFLPGSPCFENHIGRRVDWEGGYPASASPACTMSYDRLATAGVAPFGVALTGYAGGQLGSGWSYVWTFKNSEGDDVVKTTTSAEVSVALPVGVYTLRLDIVDAEGKVLCTRAAPDTFYSWAGKDVYLKPATTATKAAAKFPYSDWNTAATDLKTAAKGAFDGQVYHFAEGTHQPSGETVLRRAVTMTGGKDPTATTLDGKNAIRLVRMHQAVRGAAAPMLTVRGLRFYRGLVTTYNGGGGDRLYAGVYDGYFHGGGLDLPGGGAVSNCVFDACRGARQGSGFGLYQCGGSVVDTVFQNCVLNTDIGYGAAAALGGGTLMDRCRITGTTATSNGHKSYQLAALNLFGPCEVRNSIIDGNTFKYDGTGTRSDYGAGVMIKHTDAKLVNCTITGNRITSDYGASGVVMSKAGTVKNCIIVDNYKGTGTTLSDTDGKKTGTWAYNCVTDTASYAAGGGNFEPDAVRFKPGTLYELPLGSHCIAAGEVEDWMEGALDYAKAPRTRTVQDEPVVDVGAVAYQAASFLCEAQTSDALVQCGRLVATVTAVVEGDKEGIRYFWTQDGGVNWTEGGETLNLDKTVSGSYSAQVRVTNSAGGDTMSDVVVFRLLPKNVYVNPASKTAEYPYVTPATAASNLADVVAISAECDGMTLNVAPGRYTVKSELRFATRTSVIGTGATPADTVFEAPNNVAVRCFALLASGSVLSNVTVKGGYAWGDHNSADAPGGNVYAKTGVLLTHCVFSGGRGARPSAGGNVALNGATMRNCEIHGSKIQGGDSEASAHIIYGLGVILYGESPLVENCIIHDCRMYKAHTRSGHSQGTGVHVISGTVRNTLVYDCLQTRGPGAPEDGTHAAGVYLTGGLLENSTVVGCCTENAAGGVYANGGKVENCIIWGSTNLTGAVANWGGADASYAYTCTTPKLADEHSFADDPRFNLGHFRRRPAYSLLSDSPCVNAGTIRTWASEATDLGGSPRILGRAIDLGCYECRCAGLVIMVR